MTDDINLTTGTLAWGGQQQPRPLDRERAMRLQLAALTGNNTEYFRTIGAILNDDTGPERLSAWVATMTVLVANLNDAHVTWQGREEVERLLREDLLNSLRGDE